MNKLWLSVVCVISLTGCAVVAVNQERTSQPAPAAVLPPGQGHTFASQATIQKLMPGISRGEALALIGRTAVTGYELKNGIEYKPVTTANPYRSQKITKGNEVYEVDYYLTSVKNADGAVTNDELTPLIFQSDKLIGKGWDFFNEKIK